MANGGLGNGISREVLSAALKEMGELEMLIMNPHKPYAFVTYRCCMHSSIIALGGCFKPVEPLWKLLVVVILFPGLKSVLRKPTSTSMVKYYNVERTASLSTSVMLTQVTGGTTHLICLCALISFHEHICAAGRVMFALYGQFICVCSAR